MIKTRKTSFSPASASRELLRVDVQGTVQGVGFRPFVYTLAHSLGLTGWVTNSPEGVIIEAEGSDALLRQFLERIQTDKPLHAEIQRLRSSFHRYSGHTDFRIIESLVEGRPTAGVMADLATCPACLEEIADPSNRRYRYPFTNCTHCGPRYSIIKDLPYDRPNTTMRRFVMCEACRDEYENPLDRRFHAQPIACPACGPQLALWSRHGKVLASMDEALRLAAMEIRAGSIVALKGIGGFQLLVDATSEEAVQRLRRRKQREEKPFAVMYPSIALALKDNEVTDLELTLLTSAQAPIVLVTQLADTRLAPSVAPGNPDCGIMLPYSPLHHLLLEAVGLPIVATSGNLSEEPICIDESEACTALGSIADFFLVHDRPIERHVDDSVVRVIDGSESVIRRARGYAPLPLALTGEAPPILAVGAHQKSTVTLSVGPQAVVSQHIGDLDSAKTWTVFRTVIDDLTRLFGQLPVAIACDLHPDYRSSTYAAGTGHQVIPVQHHYAHILSCMADNKLRGDVLGIAWDGTGYGADGTIWGGEFLTVNTHGFERIASLYPFKLPGGESAVVEPRRTALGMLAACTEVDVERCNIASSFTEAEVTTLTKMMRQGINSPVTTSMGRLFDGTAAILGLRQRVRHEGQAAMELEYCARTSTCEGFYPIPLVGFDGVLRADWRPMLASIVNDFHQRDRIGDIARRFHNSLAELVVTIARMAGIKQVTLSGGCFQNRLLAERCIEQLRQANYEPYWHQRIPPNDGGIALGQLMAAIQTLERAKVSEKCV